MSNTLENVGRGSQASAADSQQAQTVQQLLEQISARNARLGLLKAENDQLRQHLAERNAAVGTLHAQLAQLSQRDDRILQLEAVRDQLVSQLAQREEHVAMLLKDLEAMQAKLHRVQPQLDLMAERERALREMLLDAHDQLLQRDDQIQQLLAGGLQVASDSGAQTQTTAMNLAGKHLHYQQVVGALREAVQKATPENSIVLVISKGDAELVRFPNRQGWHFPRDENGNYPGYHPAKGDDVVAELRKHRGSGARYLAIPETAFWWLEHYRELSRFLRTSGSCVVSNGLCRLYQLNDNTRAARKPVAPAGKKSASRARPKEKRRRRAK